MTAAFPQTAKTKPFNQARRTATAVLDGDFDMRPQYDVLTSLLSGVGPYTPLFRTDENERRKGRKRELDKKQVRIAAKAAPVAGASTSDIVTPQHSATTSFWRARPSTHIAIMQQSVSVKPPPSTSPLLLPPTSTSTPGPSNFSGISRTSSKRLGTHDDYKDLVRNNHARSPPVPRKPRPAAKKGWKGWVEGSPPPSEKLINLDAVPIFQGRRTRSGKNFDAI
ncbi:hypothetical protein B0H11DRAFT_2230077 [Mycena galericulata]|nr:hypothetical protein B0H11DRAFT_2230077 [Mycena galericulata]